MEVKVGKISIFSNREITWAMQCNGSLFIIKDKIERKNEKTTKTYILLQYVDKTSLSHKYYIFVCE